MVLASSCRSLCNRADDINMNHVRVMEHDDAVMPRRGSSIYPHPSFREEEAFCALRLVTEPSSRALNTINLWKFWGVSHARQRRVRKSNLCRAVNHRKRCKSLSAALKTITTESLWIKWIKVDSSIPARNSMLSLFGNSLRISLAFLMSCEVLRMMIPQHSDTAPLVTWPVQITSCFLPYCGCECHSLQRQSVHPFPSLPHELVGYALEPGVLSWSSGHQKILHSFHPTPCHYFSYLWELLPEACHSFDDRIHLGITNSTDPKLQFGRWTLTNQRQQDHFPFCFYSFTFRQ